ncbi:MAG: methyltransferase domain-containing protein [Clostridia bacterium]|nr:methyltransferase domain-containing protein [Clostridia bacterium]
MADFICPVCALPLELYDRVYRCDNNHCFDKSKYGYVNLLRSNSSSAKRHGDDRLMIRARRDFLSKGYYSFLLDGLCDICAEYAPANALLIDAGCGECYYSSSILGVFPSYSAAGADISKDALEFAYKRGVRFPLCAACVSALPFEDGKADIILSCFAPDSPAEFKRILKPGGILIKVMPLEEHLFSLKEAIYENPYPNERPDTEQDGFELTEYREIRREITLDNSEDIMNLFRMTPYYYKTGRDDQQKAEKLEKLTTCAAFGIAVFKK